MTSRYSVVQYVPNPIADERINIGVVVFNDDAVRVRFLTNWDRVKCFGLGDIDFLKRFAGELHDLAGSRQFLVGSLESKGSYQEQIQRLHKDWANSIQFTEPRASLKNDLDILADKVCQDFLCEPTVEKRIRPRDRQVAKRVARKGIRSALGKRFESREVTELLRSKHQVPGSFKSHQFDAVVANGKPYFAAHGISFEVREPETLINSVSFMIRDTKEMDPDFPIGILILSPREESPAYDELQNIYLHTSKMFEELGGEVLGENQIESWAEELVARIPTLALGS